MRSFRACRKLRFIVIVLAMPGICRAQSNLSAGKEESLFLSMQKIGLGTLSGLEEKKQYLTTIELEKQKIQYKMLRDVYDNAYQLYRSGDYERSKELAEKILAIDPNFEDAQMLTNAADKLYGPRKTFASQRALIDDKFSEGMKLYREGNLVEASHRFAEVKKLAPTNMKADYWLKKVNGEIADEHIARGDEAYKNRRLNEALDQWYNALLLDKDDSDLIKRVARAEGELRDEISRRNLQRGLEFYEQGKLVDAYNALRKALENQPADSKTQRLAGDVKMEIGGSYISAGKKLYGVRQYPQAIKQWDTAREWGYDPKYVALLIDRAREQMRRENEDAKRKAEEAKREAEEAAESERLAKEEADRVRLQERAGTPGGDKGTTTLPSTPAAPAVVTEENRRAAQERYLRGFINYQNGEYEKARNEWSIAKQLDPNNADADAGLKRINQQFGGGQ